MQRNHIGQVGIGVDEKQRKSVGFALLLVIKLLFQVGVESFARLVDNIAFVVQQEHRSALFFEQLLGIVGIDIRNACGTQNIDFLLVVLVVLLVGRQEDGRHRKQGRHDDDQDGGIQEDVSVAVDVFFHFVVVLEFVLARFWRILILRATTQWSMSGAKTFMSRMASIMPSA